MADSGRYPGVDSLDVMALLLLFEQAKANTKRSNDFGDGAFQLVMICCGKLPKKSCKGTGNGKRLWSHTHVFITDCRTA